MNLASFYVVCLVIFFSSPAWSKVTLQSGTHKTQLLQLYTSQGCSSCPPADRWLSSQLTHPDLFDGFVALAFHVDYWNDLGWVDPFSDAAFSKRQRALKSQGLIQSVYTPGIVYADSEFRQWFRGVRDLSLDAQKAQVLTVVIEHDQLHVSFDSAAANLKVNVAYLKMNQRSYVTSGENHGKQLTQNFVVRALEQFDYNQGVVRHFDFLTETDDAVIVVWMTQGAQLENLQAVGGWLSH